MMSLAERLEALKPVHKLNLEEYIASLPDEDREALVDAAKNRAWTTAALLRILHDEDVSVGKESLSAWRRHVSG
jgi:alpha-D-ribose 1-methylphosphonate 5-triphosphate synthase subunit PhnL